MAATFNVVLDTGGSNGSPGTSTVVDALGPPNVQCKTADDPTVDTINPCVIPASSTNYSYTKSLFMKCTGAPATQVNNVQIYTSGSNPLGTGVDIHIGQQFPTHNHGSTAGYIKATGTQSVTGNEMTTFYTGITSTSSIFSYIQGSALVISISESGGNIVNVNDTTNYFVIQMTIASTATAITQTPSATATIQYDEI